MTTSWLVFIMSTHNENKQVLVVQTIVLFGPGEPRLVVASGSLCLYFYHDHGNGFLFFRRLVSANIVFNASNSWFFFTRTQL